ncbi:hypothetical protein [Gemmatimonas sp.]|uniref:hypothetical protein n=1 Tax=Gemmatimonas sp. TaxID=1962908 RepID=UPI0039838132
MWCSRGANSWWKDDRTGLASTRAELDAAYATQVATSSIGMQFSAGGLSGMLVSSATKAPITDLWVGTHCIAP